MSMIAKFVEVTPDRLAALIDEPDEVTELFTEPVLGTPRTAAGIAARARMNEEAVRRAPQMLAATLERMNPSIRGALETNLKARGISIEDLQAGKGGDALLKLMMQRFGGLSDMLGGSGGSPAGRSAASGGAAATISLDKAWHGLHYLLCGQADPVATPLGQVIMGGTEIGDDEMGYGPARYFTPADVATTASELAAATLETQMQARFDPARMTALELYPGGWATNGVAWLMDEYRNLRSFFADASRRQAAVITCLV